MSNLDIEKFKSSFDNGARPNRFEADFFCPQLGLNWEGLRVESCSLPGRQIETSQFSEYGPTRNLPFQLNHDSGNVEFTFLCDSSFTDRILIDAWMETIYSGAASAIDEGLGASTNPKFSYLSDYVGTINIRQLRMNGKQAMEYELMEAFPISFAPMELNSGTRDDVMRFTCTISFRSFKTKYVADTSSGGLINRGRRVLDILLDVGKLADRNGSSSFFDRLSRLDTRLSQIGSIIGP